jgi:catechol 2,3-dioxygenase-like lactoylglutathione lyase family enzyme
MRVALDHLVIAVADHGAARADYARMLARAPSWQGSHPGLGTCNTLFRLDNTYVELLAASGEDGALGDLLRRALGARAERAFALALGVPDIDGAVVELRARGIGVGDPADGSGADDATGVRRTWRSAFVDPDSVRGLRLLVIEHTSPPSLLPLARPTAEPAASCGAIDHVVVFTQDLDASLALWTERLGLAVRWREDFPARGTRNVGLDLGGIVLELIMRTDRAPSGHGDVLWGVAYRVADCTAAVARLRASGVEASDVRAGLLAGTEVANVRWSRTPTLLLAASAASTGP